MAAAVQQAYLLALHLGRLKDEGRLTVEQVSGRRIRRVRAQRLPAETGDALTASPAES